MALSNSKILLIFIFGSMVAIGTQSIIQMVYAQENGAPVYRRVVIWDLFYRMMVAAFMVGATVQGVMLYVAWHNRESNKRFKDMPRTGGSPSKVGGSPL